MNCPHPKVLMNSVPHREKMVALESRAHRSNRSWLKALSISAVAIGLIVVIFILAKSKKTSPVEMNQDSAPYVSVLKPKKVLFREEISGLGTLVAARQVVLGAEASGKVVKIHFDSGQTVHQGEILVNINDSVEQAQLLRSQTEYRYTSREFDRAKKISRIGISDSTLDQLESKKNELEAEVQRLGAQIDLKKIRASFDGICGIRWVNLGQILAVGDTVTTLTDLSIIYADVWIPSSEIGEAKLGGDASVSLRGISGAFKAVVEAIDPQVNPRDRLAKVRIKLLAPTRELRAGTAARVILYVNDPKPVITVPRSAILYDPTGVIVYIVKQTSSNQWVAERRSVQLGHEIGDDIQITRGIDRDDSVVSDGANKLTGATTAIPVHLSSFDNHITPQFKDGPKEL
jgi:RND family efflux transporter MFP subunit